MLHWDEHDRVDDEVRVVDTEIASALRLMAALTVSETDLPRPTRHTVHTVSIRAVIDDIYDVPDREGNRVDMSLLRRRLDDVDVRYVLKAGLGVTKLRLTLVPDACAAAHAIVMHLDDIGDIGDIGDTAASSSAATQRAVKLFSHRHLQVTGCTTLAAGFRIARVLARVLDVATCCPGRYVVREVPCVQRISASFRVTHGLSFETLAKRVEGVRDLETVIERGKYRAVRVCRRQGNDGQGGQGGQCGQCGQCGNRHAITCSRSFARKILRMLLLPF